MLTLEIWLTKNMILHSLPCWCTFKYGNHSVSDDFEVVTIFKFFRLVMTRIPFFIFDFFYFLYRFITFISFKYLLSFPFRMKIGIVQEEEHTKIWSVLRKPGFWLEKYHVSFNHSFDKLWSHIIALAGCVICFIISC